MSDKYIIDRDANTVTRLDNRFYPTKEGDYVPSATTILGPTYPKPGLLEWAKKHGQEADGLFEAAGERGTAVHKMTEQYDLGSEVRCYEDERGLLYTDEEWMMFERYAEFRNRFPMHIEMVERSLSSQKLGYGGTIDRLVNLKGRWYIIDLKTGSSVYPDHWAQQASYWRLLKEAGFEFIEQTEVAILHLNARTKGDGLKQNKDAIQGKGWQLHINEEPIGKLLDDFDACHYLWKRVFGDLKPRNLTYQISHQLEQTTSENGTRK